MPTLIGLQYAAGGHAPSPNGQHCRFSILLFMFCILNCNCVGTDTTTLTASTQAPMIAHSTNNVNGEKLYRNINQNLIMLTTVKSDVSDVDVNVNANQNDNDNDNNKDEDFSNAAPTAAALTSHSIPLAYPPPGTITATSTLYQQGESSRSGSSITSFDSTNGVDDRREQNQQQQQQQQQQIHQYTASSGSRIQAKDTADVLHSVPMHRPMHENHLEGNNGGGGNSDGNSDNVFNTPMYFGTENSTVVTTQIGATAHVPCSVHHIGDGVVSWIRKKDYHLLTVGLTTYSSDERFSATHLKHSEDWTLQIKFVQLRDAGVYECQVSTHPPTSIFLHLSVVEARAEISGPPIRYLTPGSSLRLQCRVVQNTEASEYIFWYHDNRMINYDIDRGINVSTEPDFQSSELTILRTRREHSGNFTCVASNTQPASVLVHIFKGDNPAAMYHGHVGASTKAYQSQLHNILAMMAVGYRILHVHVHLKIV